MKKISFLVPVFNEEKSLLTLYQEILKNIPGCAYEIIFIDDGSKDNSFSVMKELAEKNNNVKVVSFRKNFGKSAGLQTGFQIASGDVIVTIDADLQDDPGEIPKFLTKLEEGYDLVVGWKKKRRDPLSKKIPSRIFNWVVSMFFSLHLHDFNCGFKAYRSKLVKELDIYGDMHRYIPALAHARGFRVAEIPVQHRPRKFGKSKYGRERYLRGFLDLLTVKLVTHFIHSPLYLFGSIGVTFSLVGFAIGLYLTVMKIIYHQPLTNRPLLFLSVLLITVGIQFLSIGLLGELIVNQNRNTNRERQISIAERVNF
ncbi:MAG: glycosyltransferase family 2 protein [Candidatus Cloacimonetes bacterium]|nr:glycosyltransferase family 2 protein [Candidatus Cloacimonadota bacterium]